MYEYSLRNHINETISNVLFSELFLINWTMIPGFPRVQLKILEKEKNDISVNLLQ